MGQCQDIKSGSISRDNAEVAAVIVAEAALLLPTLKRCCKKAKENFSDVMPGGTQGGGVIALILLTLGALWAASGFYVVNPGENAVIQRFGAWQTTKSEPGLGYHLPAPIETKTVLNVEEIRNLNIGFAEGLTRSRTWRRRELPEESLMLTSDRNIVDLHLIIQWNIKSAEDFVFNIRDQENTIKKVAEKALSARSSAKQTCSRS